MTTTTATAPAATEQTPVSATPTNTTQTLSIISLILGITSILSGQVILVPAAALVLGILGLKREPAGRTMAVWGIVTGGVMLVGPILAGIVGFAFFAPFAVFFSGMPWF